MTPVASVFAWLGQSAALILPAALFLALAAIPLVAAATGLSQAKRTKIFRNKFGQQAASLALILLPLSLLGAAAAWCVPKPAALPPTVLASESCLFSPFLWLPAGIACLAAALLAIYRATWRGLKDRKTLHAAIGFCSSLAFFAAVALAAGGFQTARTARPPAEAVIGAADMIFFIPPLEVFELILTGISLAGALCFLYLLTRRKADDFGRDYYIYTASLCLRWAAFPVPVLAGLEIWRCSGNFALIQSTETLSPLAWLWPAAPACGLLAAAVWFAVSRSLTPLRYKELACGAIVLMYLAVCCAVTANALLLVQP
ncbi:MAG: hypothetical protein HQK81_11835 [Desulfovibrionaceae bacterium]|nr:hypothetical protein [Desulfovibrionaceae bacterium]MBF0514732.1 hypothetical protein [Desulfovibrionaceae bacterium]